MMGFEQLLEPNVHSLTSCTHCAKTQGFSLILYTRSILAKHLFEQKPGQVGLLAQAEPQVLSVGSCREMIGTP